MQDWKNSLQKYKVNCVIDGNVYFSADAYGLRAVRFNDKDNTVEIDGRVFTTTKENITHLKAKEDAFIKDLNSAKKQEDGFSTITRASEYDYVNQLCDSEIELGDLWYSNYFG